MNNGKTLISERPATTAGVQEFRWTVDTLYRIYDSGVFGLWPRVELFRGKIIEHEGQSPLHACIGERIARKFCEAFATLFLVCQHRPIHFCEDTEVKADVVILPERRDDYRKRHPTPSEVLLLIEVATSSLEYDLGEKALLYAQANILEYWVALPESLQIIVHRGPTVEGYASVNRLDMDASISPLTAPDIKFTISNLLGRTKETYA